ncbi:MAG: hypothetical protein WDZ41_02725 [Candidatus Babeliales bacterium]
MRKHVKISLLLLTAGAYAHASDGTAFNDSKTFMYIRPPFHSAFPEKEAGWYDRALARECGWGGAFQIVPFGGRSTHSSDIGKYFMFCGKSELIVAEDLAAGSQSIGAEAIGGSANPNFRDVNAVHFNIHTTGRDFKSTIRFRPRHSYAGVGLDYKQYLHRRDACEKKWWFEISTPLLWVQNDMRLTESVITAGTPISVANTNANMVEAFKGEKPFFRPAGADSLAAAITGSGWNFGKINNKRDRFRPADIEVKIGYDYLCEDMCHAEGYIGGVIPTGNRPNAEYVFEPIVGDNFHGGLMWGGSWGWEIWSSCDRYLHIEMATNGRYLFRNTQNRSMDVKFKPWSRYQLVYRSFTDALSAAAQEGINVFTRKVEVRPRFNKALLSSLVYTHCSFQAEAGYTFWAKTAEKIKLDNDFETGVTFASVGQGAASNLSLGGINRAITIKENFDGSTINVTADQATLYNNFALREQDLDFESASSPCALTHTFYGSLSYRWDDLCYPIFINAGGSYEVSSSIGAINRWMVWGKFGLSI